jgi:hypothetical protein
MMGARETGSREGLTRDELQDDLMRFEGRFSSRLISAFRPLMESPHADVRLRASRDTLAFMTSALDIAVGSSPEVDLLDMVTLVSLGRDAMTRRWSVPAYGDAGRAVADAFDGAHDDISAIASRVMPEEVQTELRQVVADWQRENSDQQEVATVRLSAYAKYRPGSTTKNAGIFSLLRGATQTADTAVLLGDRALYATQRLPYLVRLHVTIAIRETISDVKRVVGQTAIRSLAPLGGLALAGVASFFAVRLVRRFAR